MRKAIVIGSGAGGATAAKELQGAFDVTVMDAGIDFHPFNYKIPLLESVKKTGLLFDEREIQLLFPYMQVRKTEDGMILVNGIGLGGTTTLCTGNAIRYDSDLKSLGIDLDAEFAEIYNEIPISTEHQNKWNKVTNRLFEISHEMNLNPIPTPKMGNLNLCVKCGRCVLGCSYGAKWDSRKFLEIAVKSGADLITKCRVKKVVIRDGRAIGVLAKKNLTEKFYPADLVILAAGGLSTPVILQNSGISCVQNLFVDPVLCVAMEYKDSNQQREIPMPFIISKEHFILSPYFDYLSFFFNKNWKYPAKDITGIMIKLADSNNGSVTGKKVSKTINDMDRERLKEGVGICTEILTRIGGKECDVFMGTLNAGHPGGMLPLTTKEAESLHHERLPENLYVADSTLFPESLGNPPILNIIAISKRVAKLCKRKFC